MRSKRLKKRGAAAPVVNKSSGEMSYEEALAKYEEAVANEEAVLAKMSGGLSHEEVVADLFRSEEEDDAEIQAMLEDDPEGEKGIPLEQANAEMDMLLAELEVAARRRVAAKTNLAKYEENL
jgi:hypothetical protein